MQHPLILTGVYKGVTMGKNLKAYDEVCDCMGIFDDLTGTIGMVDDDRRSLDSLERLVLEMTPGLRIAWSVIDGPRAVSLTLDARTRPDLVLVDLSMESMSGVMVCRRIRRRDSMVKLLAMTSFAKETFGFDVAQAGAQGLVSKNDEQEILEGLATVLGGGVYGDFGFVDARASFDQLAHETPKRADLVSNREVQVLDLMSRGLTDLSIAKRLGIKAAPCASNAQSSMQKLKRRKTASRRCSKWNRASYRRRHAPSGIDARHTNLPVERGQPRRAGRHLARRGSAARRIVGITVRIIGVVAGVSVRVAARNLDVATVVLVVRTAVRRLRRFGALAVAVLGRQSPNPARRSGPTSGPTRRR